MLLSSRLGGKKSCILIERGVGWAGERNWFWGVVELVFKTTSAPVWPWHKVRHKVHRAGDWLGSPLGDIWGL